MENSSSLSGGLEPPLPSRRKRHLVALGLSVGTALLLYVAWPPLMFGAALLFAWVPFLYLSDWVQRPRFTRPGLTFFLYGYLMMLVWNTLCTWWVWNASPGGTVGMILANSLIMIAPWMLYRFTQRFTGQQRTAAFGLIAYWLSFEYLHHNWDLSWPWLSLGNGFAMLPGWVQWYEYTGVLGGTLWILAVNLYLFHCLKRGLLFGQTRSARSALFLLCLIFVPIGYSGYLNHHFPAPDPKAAVEVLVVQPNIDPYTEKFSNREGFQGFTAQVNRMLTLIQREVTTNTRLVLLPETAIQGDQQESKLDDPHNAQIVPLKQFVQAYPDLLILTGIESYELFPSKELAPITAHDWGGGEYYQGYNAALGVRADTAFQHYHKSKLVPGVEAMPFPGLLGTMDLLGTGGLGNYGRQKERAVFAGPGGVKAAPIICYESVFGEFVSGYTRKGANLLCIITNDGWWGPTDGYKQHLAYASLRAIEQRRWVVRSANTGVSAIIDPQGYPAMKLGFWEPGVLRSKVYLRDELTYYARNGDYLGRLGYFLAIFLFVSTLVKRRTHRKEFRARRQAERTAR